MRKPGVVIVAVLSAFIPSLAATVPAGALTVAPKCKQQNISVTLAANNPTTYHVAGWLCWQGSPAGKTVQLLEHGATYDHNYWDWPQQPGKYSYVQTATLAGYATFNIDRLGNGLSDHPDPALVTQESDAFVAHQIVGALKSGAVQHTVFSKVISVGHSAGSAIALIEAGTYHDVDGVIVTGLLHTLNPDAAAFGATLYPALQDPNFAASDLPDGYFTTLPGTRNQFFYNTAFADPAVIAKDETLKQLVSSGEVATSADGFNPTFSQAVNVPVLLVMGQQDRIFCNESAGLSCRTADAVRARENTMYGPQAHFQVYVSPKSGHDVNLHPNAQISYGVMLAWAYAWVGNGATPPLHPTL